MAHPIEGSDVRGREFGYAINLMMDYGNGRQVTISGALPMNAPLSQFNKELDKLRLTTNRQSALVIKHDRQARQAAQEKNAVVLEHSIAAFEKEMEKELEHLANSPTSRNKQGVLLTRVEQQITNTRMQASQNTVSKRQELVQVQGEIEICKAIIAACDREIADIDKVGD